MRLQFEPKPFNEALKYWDSKVQLSPSQYARLTDEAKVRAFAVAGMAKGDELNTIYQAMRKQMESGVSFADFKKDIAAVIDKRGFTGAKARRIETIFRTNLQTAYQVGRYQQMAENASNRPYWMYDAVMDGSTRPTHAAQHGKVFRHDHQFWNTWYPPNGFRCRCSVRTLSERQLKARGLTAESVDPTNKLIEPVDPVTGVKLPARHMLPDNGFAINAGKTYWAQTVALVSDRLEQWPAEIAREAIKDFNRDALAHWLSHPDGFWPLALAGKELEQIGAKTAVISLSKDTLAKQARHHGEIGAADYRNVQRVIDDGVVIVDDKDARSLIYALAQKDGYVVVVKATRSAEAVFLTSLRRMSRDEIKRDKEMNRLLKKGRVVKKQQRAVGPPLPPD